jgi:hypothetical protein
MPDCSELDAATLYAFFTKHVFVNRKFHKKLVRRSTLCWCGKGQIIGWGFGGALAAV